MNGVLSPSPAIKSDIIKTRLCQQIDNLKKDIQQLLDNKKNISKEDVCEWSKIKQAKMSELKIITEKLKNLNKEERIQIKKKNEIVKVSKTIDNLEYAAAKKKNNAVAMDKAKREKELRNETREQYIKFQNIEKEYLEYDSKKLPGNLFLHKDILKIYGLCPFIEINIEEITCPEKEKITDQIYNKRMEWLKNQTDNGALYFELYDNLIRKTKCNKMYDNKLVLENSIYEFVKKVMTESQFEKYNNCIGFLEEYVKCSIKTKRIKERYNICINDLSILYSETSLEFHLYLSIKYNIHIVVNILKSTVLRGHNSKDVFFIKEQFDELVKNYKVELEEIENLELFIKNTLRNINTDLYAFLTDKQVFTTKLNNMNVIKTNNIVQVGKYFKRWSVLTKEEQIERFESFAHFYVDKNLVNTLLISKEDRDKMVDILFNILKSNFESKKMVYRDYIWNTSRGLIETIKILRYKKDTGFTLAFTKQMPSKDGQIKRQEIEIQKKMIQEQVLDLKEIESESKDSSVEKSISGSAEGSKKKISLRTIITKESEKIINEELLYFILGKNQNGVNEMRNEDKDAFCEKIKSKLKIKKLMLNDKAKIFKKYNEIFEVVKNNRN